MTRRRRAKSGFHALGDTARGQYARKEMQMRGEVRKGLKEILGEQVVGSGGADSACSHTHQ